MKRPRAYLLTTPSLSVADDRVEPPLGLLYVAAVLRERRVAEVELIDLSGAADEAALESRFDAIPEGPFYGISCVTPNFALAARMVGEIKARNPAAHVVLGGAHVSALPHESLDASRADAVITGEGEDRFTQAIERAVLGTPEAGVLTGVGRTDIDSYPWPARDLVDPGAYSRRLLGKPVATLIGSRGCSTRCVHCNSVVMGGGSPIARYRSPDGILAEVAALRDRYECFRFNDDHFTGHPKLHELLVRLRELEITFRVFARLRDLDRRTCELLAAAGCVHVSVGIESTNSDNLRTLGKGSDIGHHANIQHARAAGLTVRGSFMVGLPHDDDSSIEESFGAAARLGLDEYAVYPLIPYPGTLIARSPERFGYEIVKTDLSEYIQLGRGRRTCFALRHRRFSPEDVARWRDAACCILNAGGAAHMSSSEVAT